MIAKIKFIIAKQDTRNSHTGGLLVFLLMLSTSFTLRSQIHAGDPENTEFRLFEAGIVAGFNMSQVHGDYLGGFNKLGFVGGPELHINFTKNWFLSLEMLFIQKGSRSTPNNNPGYTYNLRFNYLELPVLASYNDKNRLIFQAGIAYGRLFDIVEEFNGYDDGIYDTFYDNELSYIVGGIFLLGENRHFALNFRYQGSIFSVGVPLDPDAVGLANILLSLRGIYYF
jgi:hypothetical protein